MRARVKEVTRRETGDVSAFLPLAAAPTRFNLSERFDA
jgi:hypothetical protein